jgi:hypothetical protein
MRLTWALVQQYFGDGPLQSSEITPLRTLIMNNIEIFKQKILEYMTMSSCIVVKPYADLIVQRKKNPI